MQDTNPYAHENVAAIAASAEARATFLQRTYSLLMAGVFVFAATLWAADNIIAVRNLSISIWNISPWISLIGIIGGGFVVRAVAETKPINLVAYFAYAFLFGLLFAPPVIYVSDAQPAVLSQAVIVTLLVFSGLTAWVFVSRKDFSFLGGILTVGVFGLLGVAVAGLIFGFSIGLWFSVAGVLIYAGFILYDTSRILHHYPTHMHVRAAIELFVSLILLFMHLLSLLSALSND